MNPLAPRLLVVFTVVAAALASGATIVSAAQSDPALFASHAENVAFEANPLSLPGDERGSAGRAPIPDYAARKTELVCYGVMPPLGCAPQAR